jgi:hypothetical protein
MKKMNPYKTFEEFIYTIYENRDNLEKLPMCWMFMPFEKYFEGVLDRLMIFQMTELEKVENLLSRYGVSLDTSKKVNTSKHDHYSTYYTSEMERMIYEVYKYEIDRFGYVFERIF